MIDAVAHAAAARLAAANRLERSASGHEAIASAHYAAATNSPNDLLFTTHVHIAEAHRCAAQRVRELAKECRQRADGDESTEPLQPPIDARAWKSGAPSQD